jgi:hypothetical protein
MTARYTVVNYNTRSQAVISALPIAGLSYTDTLNASGQATVTIPLDAPEANATDLVPGGSGFMILRDAEPVWGGILWGAAADLSAGTLTLSASGYHSHYAGVHLAAGYTATQMDSGAMLRDFIGRANAGGSDGIATDTSAVTNTGQLRDRNWTKYEFKCVGDAITELAEENNGFNFRYLPYYGPGNTTVKNRVMISPQGGTDLGIVLTHRVNCNVTGVTYDTSSLATNVYVFGADNGNGEKLLGTAINLDLWNAIPAKDVVMTYADVKETQTLLDKANAAANIGRLPIASPTLTLYPGMFDPTQFTNGDFVEVECDYGYVALLDSFAITERKVDIDANGTETVTLSLANRELFLSGNSN